MLLEKRSSNLVNLPHFSSNLQFFFLILQVTANKSWEEMWSKVVDFIANSY